MRSTLNITYSVVAMGAILGNVGQQACNTGDFRLCWDLCVLHMRNGCFVGKAMFTTNVYFQCIWNSTSLHCAEVVGKEARGSLADPDRDDLLTTLEIAQDSRPVAS